MSILTEHEHKIPLLSEEQPEVCEGEPERRHMGPTRHSKQLWLCLAAVSIAVVSFYATRAYYIHSSWIERVAAADTYSSLYKGFKPCFDETVLGGDLWGNRSNIYEQEPSPAVDAAWEAITASKYMLVTDRDLIKMHGSTESAVEWPDNPGEYLVEFHAYHLMHCLDVLRKNAYHTFPQYFKPELLNPLHWTHWTHCLEIIRQELMCMPSMKLSRMVWQGGQANPSPEFRTTRSCMRWGDFDAMATAREVPKEYGLKVLMDIHKPAHAVQRYTPPEGYEVFHRNEEWLQKMEAQGVQVDR